VAITPFRGCGGIKLKNVNLFTSCKLGFTLADKQPVRYAAKLPDSCLEKYLET
jgi:hypothetical protein